MSGKVPPSSRATGRRSVQRSGDVARAADLWERFTGHDAESIGSIEIGKRPKVVAVIGELDGVLYTTIRDGVVEKYIHTFKAKDKPLLCVTPDGTQMLIVEGHYDFTERGIVDGSDRKTRDEMGLF